MNFRESLSITVILSNSIPYIHKYYYNQGDLHVV